MHIPGLLMMIEKFLCPVSFVIVVSPFPLDHLDPERKHANAPLLSENHGKVSYLLDFRFSSPSSSSYHISTIYLYQQPPSPSTTTTTTINSSQPKKYGIPYTNTNPHSHTHPNIPTPQIPHHPHHPRDPPLYHDTLRPVPFHPAPRNLVSRSHRSQTSSAPTPTPTGEGGDGGRAKGEMGGGWESEGRAEGRGMRKGGRKGGVNCFV